MEGLYSVAFFLVAAAQISLFGLDGNHIPTAQQSSIAMKLDAHTLEAYCNTSLHLIDKNRSCARPPRGGRPERVATLGVLSTINPNLSSTKEKTGNSFEGRYDLPSPVRSH